MTRLLKSKVAPGRLLKPDETAETGTGVTRPKGKTGAGVGGTRTWIAGCGWKLTVGCEKLDVGMGSCGWKLGGCG